MRQWGREDPQRTREIVYYCVQILDLLRHYSSNMSLESFLIFHVGVVLYCVAILLPEYISSGKSSPLQLDHLDTGDGIITRQLTDWVSNGVNLRVGYFRVPLLCCVEGWQGILDQTASLLKRQKVWDISRNLAQSSSVS